MTRKERILARSLTAPSIIVLFLWMAVPLGMVLYFSVQYYNLLTPAKVGFVGIDNYQFLLEDGSLWTALKNTLVLMSAVLFFSVGLGIILAALFDQDFFSIRVSRLLLIAPFFVMPTVTALIWKNLIMHPAYGMIAFYGNSLGWGFIDWFKDYPMTALVIILVWQWTPFAFLILLTSMQSLDAEVKEAAMIDGANFLQKFWYITLPHLKRPISVVVMIEMIFLLSVFAEIDITTRGGPGTQTTTLSYLIFIQALLNFDVGLASAGGVLAIILANVVAIFLLRSVSKGIKEA